MFGGAIATVALEPVAGMVLREGTHRVVPHDFGHHASRGDRRAPSVGPRETLYIGTKLHVAVGEPAPRMGVQRREGLSQGFAVRLPDAVAIDPPGGEAYDRNSLGAAEQGAEDLLSQIRTQRFGVVDVGDLTVSQDDGRRDERPRQGAPAGLIGPGERATTAQKPRRVEGVEPLRSRASS